MLLLWPMLRVEVRSKPQPLHSVWFSERTQHQRFANTF